MWLLSTDDGYGFIAKLEDLITDRKAGKAVVNVSDGATVLRPQRVTSQETDRIAAATTSGKLLLFDAAELPLLARGKGVQTIKLHKTELFPEKVVGDGGRRRRRHAGRARRQAPHESEGRRSGAVHRQARAARTETAARVSECVVDPRLERSGVAQRGRSRDVAWPGGNR